MKQAGSSLVLAALAAALFLSGCQRQIDNDNLAAVRPQMSTKEVESILGQPDRTETTPAPTAPAPTSITRYIYEQNGQTVELTFKGDRLAEDGIRGSFQ